MPVHQAHTKIKVVNPLAKHVPAIRTALLVRPVVSILQLLVLSEPMPVVQHRANHAVLGNTTIKPVKRLVKVALLENTKTKRGKHRAKHVQLVLIVM